MTPIPAETLRNWVTSLTETWGYTREDAEYLTDTLVDANLRGVDSHGVIRLDAYHRRITANLVRTDAEPQVTVNESVVTVDAAGSAGQFAARAAVDAIAELSDATGVAAALIHGSAHFGTAGYYARALSKRGKIAIIGSNSEPAVVPFGGREAFLGTNPLAMAAPTGGAPVCLDMATSTSAMGQVIQAQALGREIPDTWGVDSAGFPTTNPNDVEALLPAAGPKGYGLGFFIEVIGGVLSGAAVAHEIGNMYRNFDRPQNLGHFMIALDIQKFRPLLEFTQSLDKFVAEAHSSEPASGIDSVLVPGEPQEQTRDQRLSGGIPLPKATVNDLRALGKAANLPFPETA